MSSSFSLRSLSLRLGTGDLFFGATPVAVVIGCALRPDRARGAWRVAYDIIILSVLLLHVLLYFSIAGAVSDIELSERALMIWRDSRAVLILGCAYWLAQGSQGVWRRVFIPLAASIAILFAGSAAVARAVASGAYHPGLWDLPWTLSFLGVAFAARSYVRAAEADMLEPSTEYVPDWADVRHETAVAFAAILFVPALDFGTALATAGRGLADGPALSAEVARLQAAISLATTIMLAGLLLARQLHMLSWVARVHEEREETLRRSEERLAKINEELRAKNEETERIVYSLSHDLKSPLVTIRGFVGLLRQELRSEHDSVTRHVETIGRATDTMQRLLADLLDLAGTGRLMDPTDDVPMDSLAREALTELQARADQRGIALSLAPDLPVVVGDRHRLKQVFHNLVENAIQHMGEPAAARVEIGIRQGSGAPVFFVRDNGVGIEPPYHEKVFGLFERLSTRADGTGIGLAVVERIVALHGGRVWVESAGDGTGCTFCFTLERRGDPGAVAS